MTTNQLRLVTTGALLLFTFFSGFWLSCLGKPHPGGAFNLHELIGLATGVFLIVMVIRAHRATPLEPIQLTVIFVTVLIFAINIIAGGLLSIAKPMPAVVKLIHHLLS